MWKVQLFKLNYDHREHSAVQQVLADGWLTSGPRTAAFEEAFSEFLGRSYRGIAVSSCTAALHLAMLALEVGEGDDVVIPALTFVADANAVTITGARPILADSTSISNWNVSAATIEKAITPQTKAVIVVHFAGFPCDMPAIAALCKSRDLKLVEDVAHAPGATIKGQQCGTWGDLSCFSFFSNKNISTGEGGMLATADNRLYERIRYLRSHGMTTLTLDRHEGRANTYDVVTPGLNYRIDEIRASLGSVQLEKLNTANTVRGKLFSMYEDAFRETRFTMPFQDHQESYTSAYHIAPILLPSSYHRSTIMTKLRNLGIQTSIHYPSIQHFTAYQKQLWHTECPVAKEISDRELTLPLFPTMSEAEVKYVTNSLLSITQ